MQWSWIGDQADFGNQHLKHTTNTLKCAPWMLPAACVRTSASNWKMSPWEWRLRTALIQQFFKRSWETRQCDINPQHLPSVPLQTCTRDEPGRKRGGEGANLNEAELRRSVKWRKRRRTCVNSVFWASDTKARPYKNARLKHKLYDDRQGYGEKSRL